VLQINSTCATREIESTRSAGRLNRLDSKIKPIFSRGEEWVLIQRDLGYTGIDGSTKQ